MARLPRLVVAGHPHYVIQRGNAGQKVFLDDLDRRRYLEVLAEMSRTHNVAIHAYVLLEDQVHLLASPDLDTGLGKMMQSLGRRFVAWYNNRHNRTGTPWDGRFRAAVIDSEHFLLPGMALIELLPVRKSIVPDVFGYAWSSAGFHLGRRQDPLVTDHPLFWALGNTPFEREAAWRAQLGRGVVEQDARRLVDCATHGWACGDGPFLGWLKSRSERPVSPRPRGRPARNRSAGTPKS